MKLSLSHRLFLKKNEEQEKTENVSKSYPLPIFNLITWKNSLRSFQLGVMFTGPIEKYGPLEQTPSWKPYTMQLRGSILRFFNGTAFCGYFDLKNCSLDTTPTELSKLHSFKLISSEERRHVSIILAAQNENDKRQWMELIACVLLYDATMDIKEKCPQAKSGILKKGGQIMSSIQRIYQLEMGMLSYFDQRMVFKGQLYLKDVRIDCLPDQCDIKIIKNEETKVLIASSVEDCQQWYSSLLRHITYANDK